jgi:hypothetical protein
MREDPNMNEMDVETTKIILKKEIEKHEIDKLKWTVDIL